jgi:hypothetical protein
MGMDLITRLGEDEIYISDCEVDDEHPIPEWEVWIGYADGEWETLDYFTTYDDALTFAQHYTPVTR